jgi:hypothetical protein
MASGHVNRAKQAEHMAAPTNAAQREDSPCQPGAVHTWPSTDMPNGPDNICLPEQRRSDRKCEQCRSLTRSGLRLTIRVNLRGAFLV